MIARDPIGQATAIQRQAADPSASVALRASAGSGKTKVLIDRFVRLCIEGEANTTHPRSILAITFTRKAATEIQERLVSRARTLALADADELDRHLRELFGRDARPAECDRAARLYERLLENLGGLQVGTLHAFCQRILTRFATEAGIDPRARLSEDREELLDETLDQLQREIADDPRLTALAQLVSPSPEGVRGAMRTVFAQQMRLERWLRRAARRADLPLEPRVGVLPRLLAELRTWLAPDAAGSDATSSDADWSVEAAPAQLLPTVAAGLDHLTASLAELNGRFDDAALKRLATGIKNLEKSIAAARAALAGVEADDGTTQTDAALAAARLVLLTTTGTVRSFTRVRDLALKDGFQTYVLEAGAPLLHALRQVDLAGLYARNRAQLELGLRALDVYAALKQRDAVIDFGDLEELACRLMGDEARALSLLYRLDDSIRHILLDEFQDTNWNQLEILEPFIREFLAGRSDGPPATVFAVGDLKQSIYAFRGAEPAIFAGLRDELAARDQLTPTLPTNFRSLAAVVDGVGAVFQREPLAANLPDGEGEHVHQAVARTEAVGQVAALAPFTAAADGRSAQQVAADAAARLVRGWVDTCETVWERDADGHATARPMVWNDVLVLMRSRTDASLYEQAFRRAGVPIEPAGRGMLAASREVQDVLALLRWLVWPADNVALATVLRSPLFRLSEAQFQQVLGAREPQRRDGAAPHVRLPDLREALARVAKTDARVAAVDEQLRSWRAKVGFNDAHELLRRIVREGDVLARYEAALGPQARINLERLFDLTLGADVGRSPTVRRFIDVVDRAGRRGGEDEGAPPRDAGRGRVRLLTIHGAKGLEAPVVLLVDADRPLRDGGAELRLNPEDSSTGLVFGTHRALRQGTVGAEAAGPSDLLQVAANAARRSATIEENNLLYVAMTRARDRLCVLGGKSAAKDADLRTPLAQLRHAAGAADPPPLVLDDPEGWERPPHAALPATTSTTDATHAAPVWQPPRLTPRLRVDTPSALEGETPAGSTGPVRSDATAHGTRVHLLLQLACETGAVPPGDSEAHLEAATVFNATELAWIFRPETDGGQGLCEVPFLLRRPRTGAGPEVRLTGFIDRLVVRPGRVDIIDYKTNRDTGGDEKRAALRDRYAPQLTAYRDAVRALYPGDDVRAWLLFTEPGLPARRRLERVDLDAPASP